MATQTIQFSAATGLTLTAKLFAAGSDTVTDSQSATEGTNRKGVYTAAFTDVAAGTYQLIAFSGSTPVASWWVDLTLTTATFQSYEIATSTVQNGLATATDVTDAVASLTSFPSSGPVERSPNDTKAIAFSWPVSGATITADVSLDNAAYAACTGTVSFLRTEGSSHYYSLAYHADDRPTAEGTARYQLDDGTYTQYFTLRVDGISAELLANARIAAQNTQ